MTTAVSKCSFVRFGGKRGAGPARRAAPAPRSASDSPRAASTAARRGSRLGRARPGRGRKPRQRGRGRPRGHVTTDRSPGGCRRGGWGGLGTLTASRARQSNRSGRPALVSVANPGPPSSRRGWIRRAPLSAGQKADAKGLPVSDRQHPTRPGREEVPRGLVSSRGRLRLRRKGWALQGAVPRHWTCRPAGSLKKPPYKLGAGDVYSTLTHRTM